MGFLNSLPDISFVDTERTEGEMRDGYRSPVLAALAELDGRGAIVNAVVNGCMRVAQRSALALSTAYAFGAVDRWEVAGTGTVGAGTVTQTEDSDFISGYALHISGVTLSGGSEAVLARTRIEAKDVQRFVGQDGSLRARIKHDLGVAATATLTINKADVADVFSAVTQVAQTTALIQSGTATDVMIEGQAMGSCGNGLEILVALATGACTTKNVYVGDVQLDRCEWCRPMNVPPMAAELAACQRYFCKSYSQGTVPGTVTDVGGIFTYDTGSIASGVFFGCVRFPAAMRTAPTVTYYNPGTGASGSWKNGGGGDVIMGAGHIGDGGFWLIQNSGSPVVGTPIHGHYTTDAEL